MLYLRCPSCGYILGNRQQEFEEGLAEIEFNTNNDEETKLRLKEQLVNSLEIKRYCCKQRLLCYINKVDIIK